MIGEFRPVEGRGVLNFCLPTDPGADVIGPSPGPEAMLTTGNKSEMAVGYCTLYGFLQSLTA